MNIIFLTSSLGSGGAERVATTLCNTWATRGDKITLVPTFSGGGHPFYEVSDKVELIYLADIVGRKTKNLLGYAKRLYALRKLISDRTPDVIISFLPNVNVAAILASVFLRIPLIICERSDPSVLPYSFSWKMLCKATYRFADMLTVQTESVANKIPALYSGLSKVRTMPNPLPEEIHSIKATTNGNRKILLSLGRLSSEKQVDKMIDAFSSVASRFDDWDLHIYGDGPLLSSLNSKIEELGLESRAFLKGRTSEPWAIMAGANIFVMTSMYEGFPNALLEAMGIGLPCVVFDCPSGPREITRDGIDAVLVPLNDQKGLVSALENVMSNEDLRFLLGNQARESVLSRFRLAAVINNWDRLFKEIGAIA